METVLYPSLYEINTRVWLNELSQELERKVTFDDIPDETLDRIVGFGFDWVWFLGVWQTSDAGRELSRTHPEWRKEYEEQLPNLSAEDICGSPFAIYRYSVHPDFGDDESLLRLHQRLNDRGLRLMLDFVPNHSALDHPWVYEHPEYFIPGDETALSNAPFNYIQVDTDQAKLILAHGRDPYFSGWADTLQLNYRHSGLREAMSGELKKVSGFCDGVRCDMAMLLLPDVIFKTWGDLSLPKDGTTPVDTPFWPEAIGDVRKMHPDFVFMAEVYWGLETCLQEQGFDYTYDKTLYDRLKGQNASSVKEHLHSDQVFQNKCARFLENHDEPRAPSVFPDAVHQAAAVTTFLAPGMRFIHEGQIKGRKVKISMHLARRVKEHTDSKIMNFYIRLLECIRREEVKDGTWQLLNCEPAWPGNETFDQFIGYLWNGSNDQKLLVIINYGHLKAQCYLHFKDAELSGKKYLLRDLMSSVWYERDGNDLNNQGLYLDMPEWGFHIFEMVEMS